MNFIDEQVIKVGKTEVLNFLPRRGINNVKQEIIEGLIAPQKYISPKFFYDKKGSELFNEITQLKEYYPTNCEKEILSSIVSRLNIDLRNIDIIELGSGDSSKISSIFRQIAPAILSTITYYPVDISQSAISNAIEGITERFELRKITGIVADFHHQLDLIPDKDKRLFCFLGSTIGNFSRREVENFMTELGASMNKGDGLLLGVDMVKDTGVINAAYNDSKGITAQFNKNILNVINHHTQSAFNPDNFEHLAFYNDDQQRIEMHLESKCTQTILLNNNQISITLQAGETIHTENSYKYTIDKLRAIGELGGMRIEGLYSDTKEWFNLVYFVKG
ncbi:MAG: L-histidine N(alpha)-methyltransferase [Bacteroidales bacterium]|nr:L-histidine N(alpha)-methyltransferase [Bacteroidales bacterium]